MILKTAIKLLLNGNYGKSQLFFGHVRIYKNYNLVVACGLGTMLIDKLHEPYLNDNVKDVLWHCHDHVWEFYL